MRPSQSQSCVKALNQILFSIGQNSNDVTQVQGSFKSRKTSKTSFPPAAREKSGNSWKYYKSVKSPGKWHCGSRKCPGKQFLLNLNYLRFTYFNGNYCILVLFIFLVCFLLHILCTY